jgi:glycosyltransferase involved in cell wall biosynthesis
MPLPVHRSETFYQEEVKFMRLIINIPAYNEEEKIGATIQRIPRSLPGIAEVFVQVVDDGSTDRTAAAAREAGADIVYSNGLNRGIGRTFRHAVERALENGADIMVNIDADGQFDPADIEKLIAPLLAQKADLVSADRFSGIKAKNIPFVKDTLNRLAASLIGFFMNEKITDLTCGFRAYSRETLLRLNLPGDFTYTQETIIDAIGKNLRVIWVPVEVTYFPDRTSRVVRSIGKYLNSSIRIILKAVRDVRPMKFFGIPGAVLILLSLLAFLAFLVQYFSHGLKVTPYLNYLLFGSVTFLIGMQLLIFAFVADMIKTSRRTTEDLAYFVKKNTYQK